MGKASTVNERGFPSALTMVAPREIQVFQSRSPTGLNPPEILRAPCHPKYVQSRTHRIYKYVVYCRVICNCYMHGFICRCYTLPTCTSVATSREFRHDDKQYRDIWITWKYFQHSLYKSNVHMGFASVQRAANHSSNRWTSCWFFSDQFLQFFDPTWPRSKWNKQYGLHQEKLTHSNSK